MEDFATQHRLVALALKFYDGYEVPSRETWAAVFYALVRHDEAFIKNLTETEIRKEYE